MATAVPILEERIDIIYKYRAQYAQEPEERFNGFFSQAATCTGRRLKRIDSKVQNKMHLPKKTKTTLDGQ